MQSIRVPILVVTLLCASVPEASALYVFSEDDTDATYMMRYGVCLAPGGLYEFRTGNLSHPWADPVMHLLRWDDTTATLTEVAFNDDGSDGVNPRILVLTSPGISGCTWRVILVRAYDNASGGSGGTTFDLFINGGNRGTFRLGGFQIDPGETVPIGDTMETVLVNNGTPDTLLTRFDWDGTHYMYEAWDFQSGVGQASRLAGGSTAPSEQWVISSTWATTREGPIRALRNDAMRQGDADGDGLGPALEDQLCTCRDSTAIVCGLDCSTVDPRDTDGDGLRDDWEARGLDNEFTPQLFPLWGASPLRKDIFVEIDRGAWPMTGGGFYNGTLPSELKLFNASNAYRALNLITNPDGTTGVEVHFDVPFACNIGEPGNPDGITDYCGMFGGASNVLTNPGGNGLSGWMTNMAGIRRGMFHWALGRAGGQGGGRAPGLAFWISGGSTAGAITQELGHNLNLCHWGGRKDDDDCLNPPAGDPLGRTNRKAIYDSSMNYTYTNIGLPHFSDGSRDPIDPTNLSEWADYSPGADISFLALANRYGFDLTTCGAQRVDWNRDGDCDASVRAYVHGQPRTRDWGGLDAPAQWARENVRDHDTDLGPAAAYFLRDIPGVGITGATWLIINDPATNVFTHTWSVAETSGWADWTNLGTRLMRADSEPSAAVFPVGGVDRLAVFGVDSLDRVTYSTWDEFGSGTGWAAIQPPVGVTFKDVAVATVGARLYVVGRDLAGAPPTDELWFGYFWSTWSWSSWSWSGWRQALDGGTPIESDGFTPGIAAGPDGKLYVLVKSTTAPRTGDLDMYIVDPATGSWTIKLDTEWSGTASPCDVNGRPGIAFRTHPDALGNPLPSGNGALWMWWHVKHNDPTRICGHSKGPLQTFHRWTWGKLNASIQSFVVGKWHYTPFQDKPTFCHTDEPEGAGMAVVDTPFGVHAYMSHIGDSDCPQGVVHLPFADGQAPVTLSDFNDHAEIDNWLCKSLRYNIDKTCQCNGNLNASCFESNPPPAEVLNENQETP